MNLSEKLLDIFSKAKTNKQVLLGLKNSAVHAQSYEFAKYIDDLILENLVLLNIGSFPQMMPKLLINGML